MDSGSKSRLAIKRVDEGHVSTFVLNGGIDEHAELSQLFRNPPRVLVLFLKGVTRINSVGVKNWIESVKKIPKATTIYLQECSVAIVSQINMVKNFAGRGQILSFYAPYYCETCDIEYKYLFDVNQHFSRPPYKAPDAACIRCKNPLQFDDIESDYLQIVSLAKKAE